MFNEPVACYALPDDLSIGEQQQDDSYNAK